MYYNGMKFSDRLIKKAAIYYVAHGRSYLYKRLAPLPDGSIKVTVYQTYKWTGAKSHIADVLYIPEK